MEEKIERSQKEEESRIFGPILTEDFAIPSLIYIYIYRLYDI